MVSRQLQTPPLVFTVCLVLVITSAGNFKVSAESQQCVSAEERERALNEIKQQMRVSLTKYLTKNSGKGKTTELPKTVQSTKQSTELPTTGQTTEQSTNLPTTGQTTEQSTELPTTGQTTKQSTESPTTEQTTEQSTEPPTTVHTTEHSMSTTTDPLYACNGTPGWRRVVFINMTDNSTDCPPGLNLTSYSKRTCGRAHTNAEDCSSTTFSVEGSEYSQVCGRIRGYQRGSPDAFWGYLQGSQSIEGWYVDGVSLTHGPVGERNHIWTFAAGYSDLDDLRYPSHQCPCVTSDSRIQAPPFIGNDYFCESGTDIAWSGWDDRFFPDDPLWDGQGCLSTTTCCQFNNPPWFTKNLPKPTTDDIEFRTCFDSRSQLDDIAIELIELYIW